MLEADAGLAKHTGSRRTPLSDNGLCTPVESERERLSQHQACFHPRELARAHIG